MTIFDLVADSEVAPSTLLHEFIILVEGGAPSLDGAARLIRKGKGTIGLSWKIAPLGQDGSDFTAALTLRTIAPGKEPGPMLSGYRDAFEHAVEGLYRSTIDGRYLQVNPALARMYGYRAPDELISGLRDIRTQLYLHPTRREEFIAQINQAGFVSDFESEVVRADGRVIWIAEYGRIVRNQDGRPIYFEGSVIDISERKRAEEELRRSEEKYRHLVEMTSVVPWEADLETGVFTYVGPQAADFLGYPTESWLEPDFWSRAVHEEDRKWVSIVRCEAITKRQRFECEYRLVRADGQIVWIREIVSVLPGEDGSPALGGFILDVTYRRESEASLRESENFIEQIAAASPTILYLYDPVQQRCTYVNGRVPDILGYTKEVLAEMQPFFISSLAHPDELTGHLEYFECWNHVTSTKVLEREFRLRNAVGGWVWLRSHECIFRPRAGKEPLRVIGTVEDITLQRTAIDELGENERIFRRLAETTGAVPFDFDVAMARFTYIGPQAEALFGHPLRRWYGRDFWESFVLPQDADKGNRWKHASPSPHDAQTEFRVRAADGRVIWIRQIVHWAADEDERRHIRGFLFDVTEARRAEEEREHSRTQLRELAARAQDIREEERVGIAREIHDELGQALTLFTIDLAWLQTRIGKTVPEEVRPALNDKIAAMGNSIQSTLQVVRRIVTALRPPLLDELGLAEAIEWQMQDFSKRVGIRYEVEATPITRLSTGSATVVFRIFQEILTNTARHAKASRIKVSLRDSDTEFVMRVQDNGVGISQQKLQHTKSFGILGMRERAWSVGGEVEILGAANHGTTVVVRLPLGRDIVAQRRQQLESL